MNIENLKKSREFKGLTQNQVAEILGISDGTYKNYEQGKREPNGDMIVKLATLYNVTTDYLLGKDNTPPNPIEMLSNDKLEQSLIYGYFKLPKEVRMKFLEMMVEAVGRAQQEKTQKINVTYSKICADEGGVTIRETPAGLPKISEFFDD